MNPAKRETATLLAALSSTLTNFYDLEYMKEEKHLVSKKLNHLAMPELMIYANELTVD